MLDESTTQNPVDRQLPLEQFARMRQDSLHQLFFQHLASPADAADFRTAYAPGRVNLIGEHTDYNGGFVFPMALELGVVIYFRPRPDNKVRLYATYSSEVGEFSLSDIKRSEEQPWLNYPMGVAQQLLQAGVPLRGLEGVIDSNLPVGGGLSSSAALEVASAQAFLAAAGQQVSTLKLALLCQQAENQFVGLNCGIMDQFISLFAQPGSALFLDTRDLLYRHVTLPRQADYLVVVCDSRVKHSLASSEYNNRRRECEQAVELLQSRLPQISCLRDVSPADFCAYRELLPPSVQQRAEHVVFEIARTRQACMALEEGDIAQFGQLMYDSHASLRDLYQVSCAELDLLVKLALEVPGVVGSRMTGGGFGGCTVSLAPTSQLALFRAQVTAGYQAASGLEPRIFASGAGAGAGVL